MTERSFEKAEGSREEEAGCMALKAKKRNDAGPETAKRCGARLRVSSVNVPKPSGFEGGENIV